MQTDCLNLVVIAPDGTEQRYPVKAKLLIGRSENAEIHLEGEGISRDHCTIEPSTDQSGSDADGPGQPAQDTAVLRDLGSTNGSFVNGVRVKIARVKPGDTIVLGRQRLKLVTSKPRPIGGETVSLGSTSIEKAIKTADLPYPPPPSGGERAAGHLAALYRIIDAINTNMRDEGALYPEALSAMMDALGMDLGVLFLATDRQGDLRPVEIIDRAGLADYEPSATVLARVFRNAEAVIATDVGHSGELGKVKSLVNVGVTRIFAAPLTEEGRPRGVVYLSSRRGPTTRHAGSRGTVEEDFAFFTAAIKQLSLAGLNHRECRQLQIERDLLRENGEAPGERLLVGSAPGIARVRELIQRAARFDATILVTGETGTGKELVARSIHTQSGRRGLFVPVNCGAIPAAMMESDLFGHEKGAFTGAHERKIGKLELAAEGTLFLDEVAELSQELQVKLLRVLEDRRFYRVGGTDEVQVDVRFIAATHRDLGAWVADGRFREDLLFRLRVFEIHVPPLADRPGDIKEIAAHLLNHLARQANRPAPRLGREALARLETHDWPGNVRELRNVLERALILLDGDEIGPELLVIGRQPASAAVRLSARSSLKEMEREHIRRVLAATGWNKTAAAEILGIGRPTIYEKIRVHDLEPPP